MSVRRSHTALCVLISVLVLAGMRVHAQDAITVTRYVTDRAGVLGESAEAELESRLRAYDEQTSSQFVVVILSDLEGEGIEDAAMRIAEANRIGVKGRDNGLLFLVAIGDRKMRFEVGYGLEGVLTDALTSAIIREIVAPRFRDGDYAAGIIAGMDAAMRAARGEFQPTERKSARKDKKLNIGSVIFFIIILFVIIRRIRGGRGGRGGGLWIIPTPFGGFGGGSGFSSGGGGFGGFSGGGGSFGGGGSSGDW